MGKENKGASGHNPDPESIVVYFNGSCEPTNPGGTIGYAAVVRRGDELLYQVSDRIEASKRNSNHVAEYIALIKAMEWMFDNGFKLHPIEVYSDSDMIVKQMSGVWGANGGLYFDHYMDAYDILPHFANISFFWFPSKFNNEARALAQEQIADVPKTDWNNTGVRRWNPYKKFDPRYK